jgi:predicted dehydrogenase
VTKIRAGVIGTGYLGRFHAEKYAGLEGVELVGVVDLDVERASGIAERLGTQAFSDSSGLLGRVDAVSIATPTVMHHRIARQFLDAGIHVLLEKPMTVTLGEADELISIADSRGCVLQIGHIERFNPAVTVIKPLLAGANFLQAERCAPFTVRCTDVNVVLDLMIHDLDIVSDIAGAAPRLLCAAGASVITGAIDTATARIVFKNGCIADVSASRVSEEKKRLLRIFDTNGLYTADFQTQKAFVSRRGTGDFPGIATTELATERHDTLLAEIMAFLQSVRERERPLVSGFEGRQALALAQLITRNIEDGNSSFVPVDL